MLLWIIKELKMRVENLKDLVGKEAYEVKFIHLNEELEGYVERFIITNTENNMIKILGADDPYHDVVMCLDTKAYQRKIDNCEIECQITDEKTFKGIEIVDKLNGL